MFPQPTSLQAYAELVRDGRITKQQLLAWTILQKFGPSTGREVDQLAETAGLWKRLSELARLGLVVAGNARICQVSGKHAVTWRIVRQDEIPPKPRRTRPRRRFWIVRVDAIAESPEDGFFLVYDVEAKARAMAGVYQGRSEMIEVREVMRGHQKPTASEESTCSSQT